MGRSKWKLQFIDSGVLKFFIDSKHNITKKPVKIWSRRSKILPFMVGLRFLVYNGQKFIPLIIREDMVGHNFGEFIFTRKFNQNKKLFQKRKK